MTELKQEGTYHVKTANFEGPLEALLSLIEKRKLFINEITLAEVTNDYIEYLRSDPIELFSNATNFLFIASTLILIKSRSLLPNLSLSTEEEKDIVELEKRLALYQLIRTQVPIIEEYIRTHHIFFAREAKRTDPVFVPEDSITADNLYSLISNVLERIPKDQPLPEINVVKAINLEEMIENLTERMEKSLALSFNDLCDDSGITVMREKKLYVIVSFLAMLELIREGLIDGMQERQFTDIAITKQELKETR